MFIIYASRWCIKVSLEVGDSKIAQNDSLVLGLVEICKDKRLQRLLEWPRSTGGSGRDDAGRLVGTVVNVLHVPFTQPKSQQGSGNNENTNARVQKIIYNQLVVKALISTIAHLSPKDASRPVGFLYHLILTSPYFIKQFLHFHGLHMIKRNLLAQDNPPELIVDMLQIASQLARSSENVYRDIRKAGLLAPLKPLLEHKDGKVRAKVCNSLGNFCRHSVYFYNDLKTLDLINGLVACCRDSNSATRKFAAFAVGNAVFYDDSLCLALAGAIPALVALLRDEPKTVANAAAAIGNLVRNSDIVVTHVTRAGAIEAMLNLVTTTTQHASPDVIAARRIAVFSLGNLANYAICRPVFQRANTEASLRELGETRDSKTRQYLQRLLKKLSTQVQ